MKIKIDLNFYVKDLKGNPMKDVHAGEQLGYFMSVGNSTEPIKYDGWSKTLYRHEALEVDKEDYEKIKNFTVNHQLMVNITKSAILEAILKAKDDAESSPKPA